MAMLQNELDMSFNYAPVLYGDIKSGKGKPLDPNTKHYKLMTQATHADLNLSDVLKRQGLKPIMFNKTIAWEDRILPTIPAALNCTRGREIERISEMDVIHAQTFPEDFDFILNSWNNISYVCGMSVPPVMVKRIITRLIDSGVYNYKIDNN